MPERTRQIPICQFWYRKSARGATDDSKTDIVVRVVDVVVVAIGGAAIPRIVVPGTAPFWVACPTC